MSSPKSIVVGGQVREGTRVVLREITAMLHNTPTQASPRRKSGSDNTLPKAIVNEHEVKVRFAREFADADSVTYSAPDSLSSASSFYSISSTLSTKSGSGIGPDTTLPDTSQLFEVTNSSYVDNNIPGVDDLICAFASSVDLSTAETVRAEETNGEINESKTIIDDIDREEEDLGNVSEKSINESISDIKLVVEALDDSESVRERIEGSTDDNEKDADNPNETIKDTNLIDEDRKDIDEDRKDIDEDRKDIDEDRKDIDEDRKDIDDIIKEEIDIKETYEKETSLECADNNKSLIHQELQSSSVIAEKNNGCNEEIEIIGASEDVSEHGSIRLECENNLPAPLLIEDTKYEKTPIIVNDVRNELPPEELNNSDIIGSNDICEALESLKETEQYEGFKPQRQSTSLSNIDTTCTLKDLELAAGEIADDILKSSLELEDEVFTTPALGIFEDPSTFDFLLTRGNSQSTSCKRNESLYIKFDPLLNNASMLPQESGKVFSTPPSSTINKLDEIQEKNDTPTKVSKTDTEEVKGTEPTDLELLRATVLQLEKELEKQKKEFKLELEQQKTAFEENILKLKTKLSDEIESKNQLTVVVDEYEKSISRLLTEKERDRANLEQEKAKLQEELQATNHHLSNTEAAFNDVHLKYERLKGVVAAYKNNEGVLKESIQENLETIKSLENRYEQLKNHAMLQLRKANFELVDVRKQHEAETAKLHALVRKAELKSNSLSEIIEQKTKENKELTQILDELIARVGRQDAE